MTNHLTVDLFGVSISHFLESPDFELYKEAVLAFNKKPQKGIRILKENNPDLSSNEIADFLFTSIDFLDPEKVGEFFGEPENIGVLKAYLAKLNLKGLSHTQALRHYLDHFKLPGEAQKIDRIVETFAEEYFKQNPDSGFVHLDAIFVLAFSTIMLNSDLHNNSITNKMSFKDFKRNNEGMNRRAGEGEPEQDFPEELLKEIYDSIQQNPIEMEKHQGKMKSIEVFNDILSQTAQGTSAGIVIHQLKSRLLEEEFEPNMMDDSALNLDFSQQYPEGSNTSDILDELEEALIEYHENAVRKFEKQSTNFGLFKLGKVDQSKKTSLSTQLFKQVSELKNALTDHPDQEGYIRAQVLKMVEQGKKDNIETHKGTFSKAEKGQLYGILNDAAQALKDVQPKKDKGMTNR